MTFDADYAQPRRINWRLYRDIAIGLFCLVAMTVEPNDKPNRTETQHEEQTDGHFAQLN